MKISLFAPFAIPLATPEYVAEYARVAEDCGFHALWAPEHVVLFDEYESKYPYSPDGRMPGGPVGVLEPLGALHFVAALTSRIRLGTGVIILPQRNPVYTAKAAAGVDWLSGGRLDLGIGVGWLAEEMRATGTPFERRGARNRSYVEVMKRLWSDEAGAYADEFYELPDCHFEPKPVQRPHPPLFFGGESEPALRRVAEQGQGWNSAGQTPERMAELLARLDVHLAEQGRTRDEIHVAVSPMRPVGLDDVKAYRDAGVEQVIALGFALGTDQIEPTLTGLAEELAVPAESL
ncbi:MAG: LLM class F420-dependent oxidoreductase [Proteobacteria bacterium]|nr:LLM class F420-dependent oxidoreductase [Pseudomonadota bacterium]